MITERPRTYGKLLSENESLRKPLEEAEQTVEAIRNGEALRESEARFRNLLLALPAAVYTTDRDGRTRRSSSSGRTGTALTHLAFSRQRKKPFRIRWFVVSSRANGAALAPSRDRPKTGARPHSPT
jgi:PAS domain-containing protein